jgi:hypothetical protein
MNLVPRKAIVSLCLLFFSFSAFAQNENLLNQMSWLEGYWINPDSTVVEHWWAEGDKMVGVVTRVEDMNMHFDANTKSEILEQLELKLKEGNLVYVAITREHNNVPMDFVFTPLVPNTFSFHNEDNDFPKWIIYNQTKPGTLLIILKNEKETKEFHFNKISP